MAVLTAALTGIGAVVGAVGTLASASAEANAAEAQAKERERVAQERRGEASRAAIESDRREKFALSTLQARAAASGGGGTDPTIARLAGGIAAEGSYQTRGAIYEGESAATALEAQASVDRMRARAARTAGAIGAFSQVLGSVPTFARFLGGKQSTAAPAYRGFYR